MSVKKAAGTAKVLKFSYLFARLLSLLLYLSNKGNCSTGYFFSFFGAYHGTRTVLKLYLHQKSEENILTSAVICLTPLIVFGKLRPMIPYGIMLIGLDAINGLNDI